MITHRQQGSQDADKQYKSKGGIQERTVIQIQFCTNCDAHLFTVRHQQAKYSSHYDSIKKKLQEHKIVVRKKSVPENLYKKSPYCPSNVYYRVENNQVVYFPEIGSFQIYLNGLKIFSKLQSLKWPTAQTIMFEIQKQLFQNRDKANNQTNIQSQELQKNRQQKIPLQSKKGQFRIKNKQQQLLNFKYSIDKRNLFKKPENNYLNRKSLTSRYQNNTESTNRNNNTSHYEKPSYDQQFPKTQGRNRNDLSDQLVIQMYQKKPQVVQQKLKQPLVPKKSKRKNTHNNIYLQPIFPKTSVNLQNYARQKMIIANKIHEQRKSYEASKNMPKEHQTKHLILNAKFNEDYATLQKDRQLKNIKEATEQNQIKQRENIIDKGKHQEPLTENRETLNNHKTQENQKSVDKIHIPEKDQSEQEKYAQNWTQQKQCQNAKQSAHDEPTKHVDINNIVTSKTINDHENNPMNSQQNAYQAQFQQEKQINDQINEKREDKQASQRPLSQKKQRDRQQNLQKQQQGYLQEFEQNQQVEGQQAKQAKQKKQVNKKAQLQAP